MVYEVCALVLTIIFGMVGLYLLLTLHSTRQLEDEARQTLHILNQKVPAILDHVEKSTQGLQSTGEIIQTGVRQVAAGLQDVKSPLVLLTQLIGIIREALAVWNHILAAHKQDSTQ